MLVLHRKWNQVIRIGDDVKITVVSCGSNFVKLGIDAPKHVEIHREEIYQKRKQQK